MLLIGSRAARHAFPDFPREPSDWDVMASWAEAGQFLRVNKSRLDYVKIRNDVGKILVKMDAGNGIEQVEIELTDGRDDESEIWSASCLSNAQAKIGDYTVWVARPQLLAVIKRSHLEFPIKWEKNIADYHWLKRRAGEPHGQEMRVLEARREITRKRFEDRIPKVDLDVPNEEFFGKSQRALGRIYEHDDLHRATCYYAKPLFETLKTDQTKAYIPKKSFLKLSHQDQIRVVREEGYAIALERQIIPGRTDDPKIAFAYAVQRICTTLTKGWFRDFAIENHPEIIDFDVDYVSRFHNYFGVER